MFGPLSPGQLGPLAMASGISYAANIRAIANLVQLFPLTETSGTTAADGSGNGYNGTYNNVTLNQIAGPGASMGNAPLFNGTSAYVDMFGTSMAAAFNGTTTLTLSIWLQVANAGVWTDGGFRMSHILKVDNNNQLNAQKTNASNTLQVALARGGAFTPKVLTISTTGWFNIIHTVDQTTPSMHVWLSGVDQGNQVPTNTFAGSLSAATLGRNAGGSSWWSGYISYFAWWSRVLTSTEIATVSTAI